MCSRRGFPDRVVGGLEAKVRLRECAPNNLWEPSQVKCHLQETATWSSLESTATARSVPTATEGCHEQSLHITAESSGGPYYRQSPKTPPVMHGPLLGTRVFDQAQLVYVGASCPGVRESGREVEGSDAEEGVAHGLCVGPM